MTSVILHQFPDAPDWAALRQEGQETAGKRLTAFLYGLDGIEKHVFALRGMAMLLIEERELFKWIMDREIGDYYQSFDRFIKQEFPNSWSYCRDALRAVKELKELPFEDLLQIKRVNLEQLKKVSSSVRLLPDVVKAAKSMPEKQFVEKLNREHQQHLEVKQPIVMADAGVSAKVDEAVEIATALYGCKSRGEAMECIAQDFISGHEQEYGELDKAAG